MTFMLTSCYQVSTQSNRYSISILWSVQLEQDLKFRRYG
jgi:hypothetical protein